MATLDAQLRLFTDSSSKEFLKFLKGRSKLIHLSNLFFRDVHYGVMSYLELNNVRHGYTNAEELTNKVIGAYEQSGVFKKLDGKTWLLNYPEFKLPVVKPVVAAKPAAGVTRPVGVVSAAPRPAVTVAPKPTTPATTVPTQQTVSTQSVSTVPSSAVATPSAPTQGPSGEETA